jgi:hypothetical protein
MHAEQECWALLEKYKDDAMLLAYLRRGAEIKLARIQEAIDDRLNESERAAIRNALR